MKKCNKQTIEELFEISNILKNIKSEDWNVGENKKTFNRMTDLLSEGIENSNKALIQGENPEYFITHYMNCDEAGDYFEGYSRVRPSVSEEMIKAGIYWLDGISFYCGSSYILFVREDILRDAGFKGIDSQLKNNFDHAGDLCK